MRPWPTTMFAGRKSSSSTRRPRTSPSRRSRRSRGRSVEQPLDALAHGEPPAGVLALHPLVAAHPPRQLLAAAQLLQLGLPAHRPDRSLSRCPLATRRLRPARAGDDGHPGLDRGAGPDRGGDRPRPRRVGQRDRPGSLRAVGRGGGGLAGDRPADRPDRRAAADRARRGHRVRRGGAHGAGAVAAVLLCRARGDRRGRGVPAVGGLRRGGVAVRRPRRPVGDGLRGGRPVGRLDRGQSRSSGCWRTRARGGCRMRCPP